jgi:hypothetical protein
MDNHNIDESTQSTPVLLLIALSAGLISGAMAWLAWRDWTIFAIFFSGLYFFGGFRFMPWKTYAMKATSTGIFIGFTCSLIAYLFTL